MRILILCLFCTNLWAMSWPGSEKQCSRKIEYPTQRVDGSRLDNTELKLFEMYHDGVFYKNVTGSVHVWWQDECPKCVQFKTVDKQDRKSKLSECIQ